MTDAAREAAGEGGVCNALRVPARAEQNGDAPDNRTLAPAPARADSNRAERAPNGRFLPGCKGGPGRSDLRRLAEHQRAVREAVTGDDLRAVLVKLATMAKAGDVPAAKVLLDRTLGRVPEAPTGFALPIELLQTAQGCVSGQALVLAALADGRLPVDRARYAGELLERLRENRRVEEIQRRPNPLPPALLTLDDDDLDEDEDLDDDDDPPGDYV